MTITKEQALRIAREDAERTYVDLSIYSITAECDGESWRVDYSPSDPYTAGGGPHYVISANNGEILSRRYEQ
jgi:hypothetical protein